MTRESPIQGLCGKRQPRYSSAPASATPNAAPICRAVLRMPAAIPAYPGGTAFINAAVAAGVISPAARPISGMGTTIKA